jgi:hypothetical protein
MEEFANLQKTIENFGSSMKLRIHFLGNIIGLSKIYLIYSGHLTFARRIYPEFLDSSFKIVRSAIQKPQFSEMASLVIGCSDKTVFTM